MDTNKAAALTEIKFLEGPKAGGRSLSLLSRFYLILLKGFGNLDEYFEALTSNLNVKRIPCHHFR